MRMRSSSSSLGIWQVTGCLPVESVFGTVHLVWRRTDAGPSVVYVSLPNEQPLAQCEADGGGRPLVGLSCPEIDQLGADLGHYLQGADVRFDLGSIAIESCAPFQREVLLAEYAIPRGAVSTYGRVARVVGHPGAGRAVGQALAQNPFPLLIPCHRAVRADGRLGGYRGGVDMKRALLQLEGVQVDAAGRVQMGSFYY